MDKRTDNIKNDEPPRILSWLISCAFFMQMIDGTILNTALPEIARSIGENPLEIQSVVIAYILTIAFFLPITGWIADKVGAKKVFIYAVAIFTLGSLSCAASQSLSSLVLSRMIQAVGGAMMAPIGRLIVVKLYPKKQLVKVLSFIMLPALFGPILGPPLGGFIVEYLSWHWIFLINIPIGIFLITMCKLKMPEIEKEETNKFDWSGFFILSIAVVFLCIASNQANIINIPLQYKIYMIAISIILMPAFWFHINKCKKPLFKPSIMEIRSFVVAILGNLFSRLGFSAMPLLIPLMFQVGLGISPSKSGMLILTIGIFSIVGKFIVEKALCAMGYRAVLSINTILIGLIICSFSLINKDTPIYAIVIILAILGTVNSIQFTSMNTLALIDLPKKLSSDGNSLLSVVMQVGFVLGISIGSSILNIFEVNLEKENLLNAFHCTFLVMGIFTIISSSVFLFTPKDAGRD